MTSDVQAEASTSTLIPPTLHTQLQELTHSLALPTPYLQPHAPLTSNGNASAGHSGWASRNKGKRKADSVDAQLEVVRSMKICVEQARMRLSEKTEDWDKLSRALKEV